MRTALVLEGGSLRCMFTTGVLDVLMEHNIKFDGVFGVSAGSLTGINYVSQQPSRTKNVNVNFVGDHRFLGMRSFFKNGSVFNFDFLFGEVSNIYLPLDLAAFESSPIEFTACATSLETGNPVYFSKHSSSNIMTAVRAGSSMPLLSKPIEIDGSLYLDGGISVAIPYQKAIDEGYDKILIITTREHGFRKSMPRPSVMKLYVKAFADYPKFLKSLLEMPRMYAREMAEVDKLELDKKACVIRPKKPINISRTEKDTTKLLELYAEGRRVGAKKLPPTTKYLSDNS